MPRGTKTPTAIVEHVLADAVVNPTATNRIIAKSWGISHDTVARMLSQTEPVASALRSFKRDEFLGTWQWAYLSAFEQLAELAEHPRVTLKDHRDIAAIRRDVAVSMGIATEKALLLSGQPTAIVASMHEVRVSLPELVGRLARVSRQLPAADPS